MPAILEYSDGHTAKMLVKTEPPSGKYILAKADEDAKKEKIKSNLLERLIFEVEEEDDVVYEQHSSKLIKKVRDKHWMQVVINGPVSLYITASSMSMTRGNAMMHTVNDVTYYARRTDEDYATYIGMDFTSGAMGIGVDKHFRKYAGEYFSDYPELAERIENKEFKVSDVEKLVEEYNTWASNKRGHL